MKREKSLVLCERRVLVFGWTIEMPLTSTHTIQSLFNRYSHFIHAVVDCPLESSFILGTYLNKYVLCEINNVCVW